MLLVIGYLQEGPPRRFEALRTRLTVKWLTDTYGKHPYEGEIVKDKEFKTRLEGVQLRLRPLIREFAQFCGPDGFKVEDTAAAVFSIRTQSVSDTSSYFLQMICWITLANGNSDRRFC